MKKTNLFLLMMLAWFTITTTQAQTTFNPSWVNSLGNPSILGGDTRGNAVVTDANGNSYVSGFFTGTCDFDPGVGTANLVSVGSADIFIAKYDVNGNYLWAKGFGSTGYDLTTSIALDANKNILITGNFTSTVDFDPGPGTANLSTIYMQEMFFAKYDSSGNYIWAKNIQGTSIFVAPTFITCANNGSFEITGAYAGTLDFDPSASVSSKTTAGSDDIFLAKYDASGNFLWVQSAGSASNDKGKSMAIDNNGNTYLTGYYQAACTFGPPNVSLSMAGTSDAFIAKYDSSGVLQYAKQIGGTGSEEGTSIKLDPANNIILFGFYNNTVDFDPNAGTSNLTTSGGNDLYIAKYTNTGNYIWAKSIGGANSYDISTALDVDASGKVVITGNYSYGTADFDPSGNTANITPFGSSDIFVAKYDSSGNYLWVDNIGGANADVSTSIAFAPTGKIVITGYINGTIDFDPSANTANMASIGVNNGYLAGYSSSTGAYTYAGQIGNYAGTSEVNINSVKTDASGNIIIAGSFSGQIDFDLSANTFNLSSAGSDDIFFAKYDASGNFIWAKQLGGTLADDNPSLELDGNGNIYITGGFQSTADFDPSASTANLTSSGSYDIFFAKYTSSGNYSWAKKMGGTSADRGNYLMFDANNNIILSGIFQTTADFDPGAATVNLISAGSYDAFIAKYDSTGNYVWANKIGGTSTDGPSGIIWDSNGNICLTGSFNGTVDFDPGAGTVNLTSAGLTDIFLALYDASGNYISAFKIGGTGSDSPYGIVKDANGNFVITGYFSNTVDFDPGAGTSNLVSAGVFDIFLAKYSSTGSLLWANKMGGTANDYPKAISINGNDNILITGVFAGTVDFDPSASTANLTYAGGSDVFVAQYNTSGNYIAAGQLSGADSENGNAIIYDASGNVIVAGNFKQTVDFDPNATTLNATATTGRQFGFFAKYQIVTCINPSSGGTIGSAQSGISPFDPAAFTSSVPASGQTGTLEYKWQSSTTSSASGFTDIASSNSETYNAGPLTQTTWFKRLARVTCKTDWTGAVSSNVVMVTVVPCTNSSTTNVSLCAPSSPYIWNGNSYSTSGTYSVTLTNVNGCDSVATLNLTITPQPAMPSLLCWQTATFNSSNCTWNVTGTQPAMPTLACYETASFNTTTCAWDVTGTQPAMPTLLCYQTATFNSSNCTWAISGTQPLNPSVTNINVSISGSCSFLSVTYIFEGLVNGYYSFYNATYNAIHISYNGTNWVLWNGAINNTGFTSSDPSNGLYPPTSGWTGTQCSGNLSWSYASQPLACYQTATWNSTTCAWDVTGTQPAMPTLACYQTASFNTTSCAWDVTGTQPAMPTLACYETALFNTTSCAWDVTGTLPAIPTLACYQTALFNTTSCAWDVTGTQPSMPTLACYQTASFNTTTCAWDVTGTQPAVPTLACYETASFNTTSCTWDVTGTQPPMPTLACYETASFNITSCAWDVTGTQPTAPTGLACYQTASLNTTSCSWVVTGTQPAMPTLACYETASFNTTSCAWDVTGSAAAAIVTNATSCGAYKWSANGQTYTQSGTYTYYANCQDYTLNLSAAANITYYADADGDGYGNNNATTSSCNGAPTGYVAQGGDCNDNSATAYPGATEICNNGIDDNCDGTIDEGTSVTANPISGNLSICNMYAGAKILTTTPIPGISTYNWTVPSDMTITAGQGTTSITVYWGNVYLLANGILGDVTVTAMGTTTGCGTLIPAKLPVDLNYTAPVTPPSISGPSAICPNESGVYSIALVKRASSYEWSVPTGATINSGNGSNIINVSYANGFTGGNITVGARNVCGLSTPLRSRTVTLNTLPAPTAITGPIDGLCNASNANYSATAVVGATGYNWSVPSNASINGASNSNNISTNFNSSFTTGNITVAAVNNCGVGATRSLAVKAAPATPGSITGPATACAGSTQSYSISTVQGASNYTWTVPGGAVINSGQGSKNLNITHSTNASTSGIITVKSSNTCGTSSAKVLAVTTTVCPRLGDNSSLSLSAFPNPATDIVNLILKSDKLETMPLSLYDDQGKLIYQTNFNSEIGENNFILDVKEFAKGLYLLSVKSSNSTEFIKIMVN